MSKTPELKPCPFCGGEASHNDGGNSVYGRLWWSVWCEPCGVVMNDEERWHDWSGPDAGKLKSHPMECFEAWNNRPSLANGRWRVFECVFDRTHFGIELEGASDDDDPILYSMKIKRETVQAIVDAHNASIEPHPSTN